MEVNRSCNGGSRHVHFVDQRTSVDLDQIACNVAKGNNILSVATPTVSSNPTRVFNGDVGASQGAAISMVSAGLRVGSGMGNLDIISAGALSIGVDVNRETLLLGERVPLSHVNVSGVGGPTNGDGRQLPLQVRVEGSNSVGHGGAEGRSSNLIGSSEGGYQEGKEKNVVSNGPHNGVDTQGDGCPRGVRDATGNPNADGSPSNVPKEGGENGNIPRVDQSGHYTSGKEDLGRWADITDEDETLDIAKHINTEGALVAVEVGLMIR
ncbi:hypothetical protein NE237_017123 [Protea cynaroides]|uniref:Uncharacterized protein n=1 Tax=Protea cynaroides TaxID=273540 RepID=A0A9Q0K7F1_9MAGN|nr:hypothetical protein NE237_017123 [Protea cynaroides]